MSVSGYDRAIRLGFGRRPRSGRMRPRLLTSLGWFSLLAAAAIAVGAALGIAQ